jgi:hypothetical protein
MPHEAAVGCLGQAGTKHNVISGSHRTAVFVEVELKR